MSLFILSGCSNQEETQLQPQTADQVTQQPAEELPMGVEVVEGVIGPGAFYGLYVPEDWNNDLVVYAHGYVWPWEEVRLPEGVEDLRNALLEMGYAVAYSSYRDNGYTVRNAVTATHQLKGIFTSHFGNPDDTYVLGQSMGGLVTTALVEKYKVHYTAAMPMCGIVGGSKYAIDHVYHVRALFDYFYPGAVPGNAQYVPEGLDAATAAFYYAMNAMLADPSPAFELASVSQTDVQYNDLSELITSLVYCVFFHVGTFADLFDRTHGHLFFDNMNTVYTGSSDDETLNAEIDRFESTPDAQNFLKNWYTPKGVMRIPILTLHTTRDPVVPRSHEDVYAQTIADAGRSDLLRQYEIDRFGHCAFTTDEMIERFQELVDWAESLEGDGSRMKRK
jgi:pimeloyl-ACP methyl ester carboxylesterase